MKILYYECFAGISGDMNLGAMIDLGVDINYLKENLSKLGIDDEFEINTSTKSKMGISGTKLDVIIKDHHHHHNNDNNKHEHNHNRNYYDIENLINKSDLSERVKKISLDIFMKIALAESKVHGRSMEEVHFHEVGATDSIVDIVGAAICYDKMGIDIIYSSTIEVGSGFVKCAHGKMPVPAPATAEILKDIKIHRGGVKGEATTPTGAAIISVLVNYYDQNISMTVNKVGYGLGTKDFAIPNLLRVSIGEIDEVPQNDFVRAKQFVIETNIDDMNQEFLPYIEEELLASGALDVFKTPIIMKKGRAAIKLSILVGEEKKELVTEFLFRQTRTLGVRIFCVDKVMLKRNFIDVETKYGTVTIKEALINGEVIKYKPEFEQLKLIAKKYNMNIQDVQYKVENEYKKIQ